MKKYEKVRTKKSSGPKSQIEDLRHILEENISDDAIGELMLAKAALEDKNEQLDEKDRLIQELRSKEKALWSEIELLNEKLTHSHSQREKEYKEAAQEGADKVIKDIVSILADYENVDATAGEKERGDDARLIGRLIRILNECYGLEVIDGSPDKIDPEIHQVIEAEDATGEKSSIILLSKGYRIGKKILRPARVKVIRGKFSHHQEGISETGR